MQNRIATAVGPNKAKQKHTPWSNKFATLCFTKVKLLPLTECRAFEMLKDTVNCL